MKLSTDTMLDAAIDYASRGVAVFPVWNAVEKRCGCGAYDCTSPGKHPIASCAPNGLKDATTNETVIRSWWARFPNANIAIRTGIDRTVLDIDPLKGGRETLAALEQKHGPLPITAKVLTGGGGEHYHFAHVPGLRNSAGRLGPGLDIRGEGGYALVPPSNHDSGGTYLDDITAPLFETSLAPMPTWLETLAMAPMTSSKGNDGDGRTSLEWGERLSGAPEGQRRAVALEIAGHYLGLLGAARASEVTAILLGYAARCTPPFSEREARELVRDLARRDQAKAYGSSVTSSGSNDTPPAPPPTSEPLRLPPQAYIGVASEFAELYSKYLETPRSFLYFALLTYLGEILAKKITLASALAPEPRLYTVLLGESADTRKSTSLRIADEFMRSLGSEFDPRVLYGVGSAEGIAAELKESSDLLLHFDELKSFVDKAKNEHSVALPMVATLFERGDYDNRTKAERLSVRGASLSLLAACTAETYATMFDQRFFAIGLLNRLWLVTDRTTARIAVPSVVLPDAVDSVRDRVRQTLRRVDQAYVSNGLRPVAYQMTSQARAIFDEWYRARTGSIFERRLDTYGHRLMVLLAATSGRTEVDATIAESVCALLRYQLDVRRECDPVDAENTIAALEERIRRALSRGSLKGRDLKRRCSYNRVGIWAWNTALSNLIRMGEVERDPKADLYWLPTTVSTSVSSAFEGPNGEL